MAAAAAILLAGCSGATAGPTSAAHPSSTPAHAPGHTLAIVGVTTAQTLAVLDPNTGGVQRTLPPDAVNGDEVAVSPDGSTVYYEERTGCDDEIRAVPVAGGSSSLVAVGALPALSPDGTKVAFARQPATSTRQLPRSCFPDESKFASSYQLVVRSLKTNRETTYPMSPELVQLGLPYPISHLSWAADGARLAVSIEAPQDNIGWALVVVDTRTARYYHSAGGNGVPVTSGPSPNQSYYREGVFMPDGNLFVNRVCCSGIVPGRLPVTSSLLWEVTPDGVLVHQVAIGFTNLDHTSLAADPTGRWLLYLAGSDLYVSRDGRTPMKVASNLTAATWAELPCPSCR